MSEKRSVWAGAMLSVLGGAGLLLTGSLASAAPSVAPVVSPIVSGVAAFEDGAGGAHGDGSITVGGDREQRLVRRTGNNG